MDFFWVQQYMCPIDFFFDQMCPIDNKSILKHEAGRLVTCLKIRNTIVIAKRDCVSEVTSFKYYWMKIQDIFIAIIMQFLMQFLL